MIEGQRGQTKLGKGRTKKVEMTLLVHPQWLAGSPSFAPLAQDESSQPFAKAESVPPFAKGGLG